MKKNNNMNYTWGILFIIGGIFGLYDSYKRIMLYLSTGDISFIVKYMRFIGDEALLLTYVNVAFSIILIYFGFIFIRQRT